MHPKDIYTVEDGCLMVNVHDGQKEILAAPERVILALCGTQSGKTVSGPIWLYQEIARCGPGDYGAVSPTFALMELKLIAEFRRLFEDILKLGKYYQAPIRKFVFSDEGLTKVFGSTDKKCVVYFGYAENPDSLESATYKAVWCDEAGQKRFKLDSWDALQRRLAVNQGRVLITTTPYEFGWLKSRIYDKAGVHVEEIGGKMTRSVIRGKDDDIRVVKFKSTMNPHFKKEEFERQKGMMPPWKFKMMYEAEWVKPAGTIYDCFEPNTHCVRPFKIPDNWIRILGVDFGQVNTAGCYVSIDPETRKAYIYRAYHTGRKDVELHVKSMLHKEPGIPVAIGGAPGEKDWREGFSRAGLPINAPYTESVEAGIDAVYGLFKTGRLFVFSHLSRLIDDLRSYSRVLDDNGEPTEKIDDPHSYHRLDALRYAGTEISRGGFIGPQRAQSLEFDEEYMYSG